MLIPTSIGVVMGYAKRKTTTKPKTAKIVASMYAVVIRRMQRKRDATRETLCYWECN